MLQTLLSILHVIACIFLILVVLLQQGRSGGLGSAFGGASQQVFGGRGAGNLLTRLTAGFATVFMLTSIVLAYLASAGDIKLKVKTASTTTAATSALPPPAPP